MNDRNQRNTASRKLPGIHPEYIIHTGVPPRRGVLLWVKGSPTPERTRPWRKRSVPVKSRTIGRFAASLSLSLSRASAYLLTFSLSSYVINHSDMSRVLSADTFLRSSRRVRLWHTAIKRYSFSLPVSSSHRLCLSFSWPSVLATTCAHGFLPVPLARVPTAAATVECTFSRYPPVSLSAAVIVHYPTTPWVVGHRGFAHIARTFARVSRARREKRWVVVAVK